MERTGEGDVLGNVSLRRRQLTEALQDLVENVGKTLQGESE